jgi:glycosyltransferase involved in cell wall biosynthesis
VSASTPPVVIDARAASRSKIGGVERLAREMAARLPALRPERYRVRQPSSALAYKAGHAWEQLALPVAARRAELIYCPANLAPLASRKNALGIHDVAPMRHPEWYGRAYARYQRALLPALARRARLVLTVSEFSMAEIVDCLGVRQERVTVVPNGVDQRFHPGADPEPARRAHGLDGAYVLAVGTRIARKNLAALGPAARRLRELGVELVAAGSARTYMRAEAGAPARQLGYVSDDNLPGLYAGATALVMPSLYEGFGLPCLEGMASGIPVVASDRGGLPELCGDAAILIDPDEPEALAEAVVTAATDVHRRERLIAAGLDRAAGRTWLRTAELTDAALAEALAT